LKERVDLCFDRYQAKEDSNVSIDIEADKGVRACHYEGHVELYRVGAEIAGAIVAEYNAEKH
jgi:hypothetical protein